ncbi:hypothetical protein I3760_11G050900 [Carya illinoinensis]|nr:hypothetical protein I3760_11G050900 [Carya illinoinensis]
MLKKLMSFAQGKIVLALEGGYNLDSIANSALACVEVLLEDKPIAGSTEAYPFESTWRVIQAVRHELSDFWPTLADKLPANLISQTAASFPNILISSSDSEAEEDNGTQRLKDLKEVLQPLSKLKVDEDGQDKVATPNPWRSELSKIDVWYAAFGSNMWKPRFLCYIEGGQVGGMQKPCSGSMDRTPPKEIVWKSYPYRLFFGRESSSSWGPGGVAFLDPESKSQDKAYLCLYRITLEQFNDVLAQENVLSRDMTSPLFDLAALTSITSKEPKFLDVLRRGWYRNVVYLGNEDNFPILTMTCSHLDLKSFKSGERPLKGPCKAYAATLIKGLVGGGLLSEEEAMAYIQEASTKPL